MCCKKLFYICIACLLLCLPAKAQVLSESATISLLSCTPGEPFYFHFGHSAIRIQDPAYTAPDGRVTPIDFTFNYGVFDFRTEHFYTKFLRGETDYMLSLEYTQDFLLGCAYSGRTVYYQPLLCTTEEKQAVLDALLENYRPENRFYRYSFVYDNCATRAWDILREPLQWPSPEGMSGRTWREDIAHFSGRWSWGKFGIDLLLGWQSDVEMTATQALFLPANVMAYVTEEGLAEEEDTGAFVPRDGRFITSPELVVLLLFALLIGLTAFDVWKKRFSWGADLLLFILYFILGCIVALMYFYSGLPFVGSNLNVLYLNPLWIVPLVLCCMPQGRKWLLKASPLLLLWLVVALVVLLFKHQSLHLMLTLVFLHSCRLVYLRKSKKDHQ